MQFIDSHTHLDFSDFDSDRDNAIKHALNACVSKIIISATTAKNWDKLLNTVADYQPLCHAAYGLHPLFMDDHKANHLEELTLQLKNQHVVAVGEIGLDYFILEPNDENAKKEQLRLFIAQLKIAVDLNLPVIIHARKSLDIVLREIRRLPQLRGSIHSFSGSLQQAEQLIELGFYLGFGGPITYTRATKLRKLVEVLPLEHLLLETDSPDQPDASHYGMRNEPSFIVKVAETVAALRKINIEEVAKTTTNNAQQLFGFDITE
jgi:TatD DNase family protein